MLVIGESLIDVVRRHDGHVDVSPGGSPANVALTLGRLGHSPTLLTSIGEDEPGGLLRRWLAASGVDVAAVAARRTATATANLDESGSASYEFDIDWSLQGSTYQPDDSIGIVHTGSIAAITEPGATAVVGIIRSLREQALVTYDPNMRPALLPDRAGSRKRVEALVAIADVVKASDEDLHWLYPGEDPMSSAARWRNMGPAMVVVTRGSQGAIALTRGGPFSITAPAVSVVDTVGAGDTFMGAMIDALVAAGYSSAASRTGLAAIPHDVVEAVLQFAAGAAAVTVSRLGADPPTRDELESAQPA